MLEQIQQSMQRGDIKGAEKTASQWLQEQPQSAQAHHVLGMIKSRQGLHDEAINLLEQATNLAPDEAELYDALASVELHVGRARPAMANFRAALKLNPNLINAYRGLGQIAMAQGDAEEAERQFLIALRVDDGDPQVLAGLAAVAMSRNDAEAAVKLLTRALSRAPDSPALLVNLGTAYRACGMLEFARQALQRGVDAHPDAPALRRQLLGVLADLGQFDDAQKQVDRLQRSGEHPATVAMIRGDLAMRQKSPASAMEHFRSALEIQPGNALAILGLARCLEVVDGDEAALACLREQLEYYPQLRALWAALVDQLTGLNRVDEAIEAARKWRSALPDDVDATAQLAMLLEMSGQHQQAVELARERIAAGAGDVSLHLIVARDALGRSAAAEVMQPLQAINPQQLPVPERRALMQTLGRCHDQLGQDQQALDCWLQARALETAALGPPLPGPVPASGVLEGALEPVQLRFLSAVPGAGMEPVITLLTGGSALRALTDRFASDPRQDWLTVSPEGLEIDDSPLTDRAELKRRRYLRTLERLRLADGELPLDCLLWLDAGHAASLRQALPEARVALILRDPRDSFVAWMAQGCMQRYAPGSLQQSVQWLEVVIRHQLAMLELSPDQIRGFRYEALVENPQAERLAILEFFGCPSSDDAQQLSQPVLDIAPGHWRKYQSALAPVLEPLTTLAELMGYPRD